MNGTTNKPFIQILVLVSLVLFTLSNGMAEVEETISKSFKVGAGGQLTLVSARGSIEVKTQTSNQLDVEILLKGESEAAIKNLKIDFQHDGNDVTIEAQFEKERSFFDRNDWNRLKVRYLITVPEKYNVNLKTSGGSISVDDLEGKVVTKTSGGSLHFGNIHGPVTGKTSGGSINLAGCVGKATIKTSGGSIRIGEVDGNVEAKTSGGSILIEKAKGTVLAKTSGGSIKVNEVMGTINASTSGGSVTAHISRQPEGDCRLSSSGGSINVHLAEGIGVYLDAITSGGKVYTDFPVTLKGEIKKNELQAKINGGGPELHLRTSGGNIKLHKM